jgi:hypothetical protein
VVGEKGAIGLATFQRILKLFSGIAQNNPRFLEFRTQASARDPKLSPAEALRRSMLAMIDAAKSDADAGPRLWAAFVVVGEPAKPQ